MTEKKASPRRGPRGSKADIDAVKKQGRKASREVRADNKESLIGLAEALGEINEGESAAHLGMRIDSLERQVERLLARREETDRTVQSEIEVMRARIEEAMEAVGSTSEELRSATVASEKRLLNLLSRVEERSADAVESLSGELASEVTNAVAKVEKTESRLKGQTRALEESVEERLRNLADTVVSERENFQAVADETIERTDELVRDASAELAKTNVHGEVALAEMRETLEERMAILMNDASSTVDSIDARFNERLNAHMHGMSEDLDSHRASTSQALDDLRKQVSEDLAESRALNASHIENRQREFEGRLSETTAGMRLESQQIRESVDDTLAAVSESIAKMSRDFATRITASQDRSDAADARLESLIDQQRREIVGEGAELSEEFKALTSEVGNLKIKSEEILGRVSSGEARRASERGSLGAAVEGMSERIEALEDRVRSAVDEVAAKHAARMEMLSSKLDQLSAADSDAEERSGAVEYLSRRAGETAERVDELMIKVNAIGRHITKPTQAALPGDVVEAAAQVDKRIERLEETIQAMAAQVAAPSMDPSVVNQVKELEARLSSIIEGAVDPPSGQPDVFELVSRLETLERATTKAAIDSQVPPDIADRLDAMEKNIGALVNHARQNSLPDNLVGRLEILERSLKSASTTLVSRQEAIDERVEELEQRSSPTGSPSQHILPGRRRRR
jgi:hypothetical protein